MAHQWQHQSMKYQNGSKRRGSISIISMAASGIMA